MATEFPLTYLDAGHGRVGYDSAGRMIGLSGKAGLEATLLAAKKIEDVGFHRYWVGEHHSRWNFQSCPELLIGLVAQQTSRMRVGTAGVLLPYNRPFKVAEEFRALASWFPGRIDLGVAKGPGAEEEIRPFLLRGSEYDSDTFRADLSCLQDYTSSSPSVAIGPLETPDIQLWCHSSNPETMKHAARLGMGLGVGVFLLKDKKSSDLRTIGKSIEDCYLANFESSSAFKSPRVIAVEFMICTDKPAFLERLRQVPQTDGYRPQLGTPSDCLDVARSIMDLTNANEFGIFQAPFHSDMITQSAALLAEAAGSNMSLALRASESRLSV